MVRVTLQVGPGETPPDIARKALDGVVEAVRRTDSRAGEEVDRLLKGAVRTGGEFRVLDDLAGLMSAEYDARSRRLMLAMERAIRDHR